MLVKQALGLRLDLRMPGRCNRNRADDMTQLYDTDFYIWTQEMAQRLRERDIAALDWENIAEEIESMGKRDYRGLYSRMRILLLAFGFSLDKNHF
jgi:hypothetical protein